MTSDNGLTFRSYVQPLQIRSFTTSQNNSLYILFENGRINCQPITVKPIKFTYLTDVTSPIQEHLMVKSILPTSNTSTNANTFNTVLPSSTVVPSSDTNLYSHEKLLSSKIRADTKYQITEDLKIIKRNIYNYHIKLFEFEVCLGILLWAGHFSQLIEAD